MNKFGNFLGALVLTMIGLSFISVSIHYLFNITSIPLQEIILYLHASVFMLGIVYAHSHDKHVRIDIFYQQFSNHKKNKVNQFGIVLLLIPFFVFMFYACFDYVIFSWSRMEGSSEAGGLDFVYGLKTLLLFMPASMIVFSLLQLIRKK